MAKKRKPKEGVNFRKMFIEQLKAARASGLEGEGDLDLLERQLELVPEEDMADMYYQNFGLNDYKAEDYLIVRADLILERTMMRLASKVARNSIDDMSYSSIRNFLRLMCDDKCYWLDAADEVSRARNRVAHELDGTCGDSISKAIKLLNMEGLERAVSEMEYSLKLQVLLSFIMGQARVERQKWEHFWEQHKPSAE